MKKLVKRTHVVSDGEEICYYVPEKYDYYENNKLDNRDRKDCCTQSPHVDYDDEAKKWKLSFEGPDDCGINVMDFQYYFDGLNDILEFMGFPVRCSCVGE